MSLEGQDWSDHRSGSHDRVEGEGDYSVSFTIRQATK